MDDWVLDSLLGFLKSPTWTLAVRSFTDKNCVVFDSGEENKFSYTDIHREYQTLVEGLLEQFTAELGISGDQFTHACSLLQTSKIGQENEELFEQVLAADDFLLFKSNMVRRNIDMELQALTLLRKQTGHSPEAYDKDSHPRGDTGSSEKRLKEEEFLKEAVKLSEAQYQLERLLDEEELERMIEQAKRESLELYQQQQQSTAGKREQEQQSTVSEREGERGERGGDSGEVSVSGEEIPTGRLPEHTGSREVVESTGRDESMAAEPKVIQSSESPVSSSTGGIEGTLQQIGEREVEGVTHDTLPPLPVEQPQFSLEHSEPARPREEPVDGGDDAMAKWLEMAKAGVSSESTTPVQPHSHRHCQHTHAGPTPEQLRARELYLKRQRDQLLETKRKQRVHSTPVNAPTTSSSQQRQGVQTPATAAVSRDGGSSGGRGGGGRRGKDTGILSSAIAGNLKKS